MSFGRILLFIGLLSWPACADYSEDMWQEPSAWERHSPPKTCPVCEEAPEKGVATIFFYKKFIANIFNRTTLKLNTETGQFERTLSFYLTPVQLDIIENPTGIKQLNTVITSILEAAKDTNTQQQSNSNSGNNDAIWLWALKNLWNSLFQIVKIMFERLGLTFLGIAVVFTTWFVYKRWKENPTISVTLVFLVLVYFCFYIGEHKALLKGLKEVFQIWVDFFRNSSDIRFLVFICGVGLCIWFVHKRFSRSLVFAVAIVFFLFGYFFTYLECNRKLEADKHIQFLQETSEEKDSSGFVAWIYSKLGWTKEDDQIEKIRRSAKIDTEFCRPDHVLFIYGNEIFFNQLKIIIEKIVETSMTLQSTLPFPINYFSPIIVPALFIIFLGHMFQHIFNPATWFTILKQYNQQQNYSHNEKSSNKSRISGDMSSGDKLSGKNLEKFLNILNSKVEDVEDKPDTEELLKIKQKSTEKKQSIDTEELLKINQKPTKNQQSIVSDGLCSSISDELPKIEEKICETENSVTSERSSSPGLGNEQNSKKEN